MGYSVKKDSSYDPTTAGGDDYRPFKALDAGPVVLSIYEAKIGEFKNGGNKGKTSVRIQFKVEEGQPGANKRLFQTVGIFEKWAPTPKNEGGADNFTFFGFFAAATGKKEKEFRQWFSETDDAFDQIPSPSALEGRKVIGKLKKVPDEYGYRQNLAKFAEENGLDVADEATAQKFTEVTGYSAASYETNEISSFAVYDGKIPAAGAANTSAPKVAAVEL